MSLAPTPSMVVEQTPGLSWMSGLAISQRRTMSDIDPATLNQMDIDRAEGAYDLQCWREDRDELLGLNDHPTLEEFQQHMAEAKKAIYGES